MSNITKHNDTTTLSAEVALEDMHGAYNVRKNVVNIISSHERERERWKYIDDKTCLRAQKHRDMPNIVICMLVHIMDGITSNNATYEHTKIV